MSDSIHASSVLLPSATIDVYVASEKTQKTIEALKEDWRFARVQLNISTTGIAEAIEKYKEYDSPDLVIVGTDDIGEGFIDQLGQLGGHCSPDTEAVVIGPKNDVQLYRDLVGMGIRDYLVRPVKTDDMVDVISQALFDKLGLKDCRLVAVIGAKGGVGTTSIAQMLAWSMSDTLKSKTLILDAAGGRTTLAVGFGAETGTTLGETLRVAAEGTDDDLKRIYQELSENLTLFASGGDDMLGFSATADGFEVVLDRVMKTFPVVVVDLSGATSGVQERVIERAHEVLVVTTPSLTALRSARTLLKEIKAKDSNQDSELIDLIVNMRGMLGKGEISDADLETALEHKPECFVPFLPQTFSEMEASGKPIATLKGGDEATLKLLDIAKHAADYKGELSVKEKEKGSLLDKMLAGIKSKD